MKNQIIVTGGAGFVGANLIELLLKKTNYKIVSLDNYSSGTIKNHIKNPRVKYLKGDTKNIFPSKEDLWIRGRYKARILNRAVSAKNIVTTPGR